MSDKALKNVIKKANQGFSSVEIEVLSDKSSLHKTV